MSEAETEITECSVAEPSTSQNEPSQNNINTESSESLAVPNLPPYLGEAISPTQVNENRYNPDRQAPSSAYASRQSLQPDNFSYISENIKHYVAQHPEYRDIYMVPAIQNAVNAYIDQTVQSHGTLALPDLMKALGYFVDIRNALTGNLPQSTAVENSQVLQKNTEDSRRKLTSTASAKGAVNDTINTSSRSRVQPTARETAWRDALKLSPQDYTRWERDPKNRAIVEWVLGQGK